jgi:hypothetical protein
MGGGFHCETIGKEMIGCMHGWINFMGNRMVFFSLEDFVH